MFDFSAAAMITELDAPGVAGPARSRGVDVVATPESAQIEAGIQRLQALLARAAAHRRVSPDWPGPNSPWAGHLPGPELAAAAARRLADPDLTQTDRLDCIDALSRSVNAIQGTITAAVAAFVERESHTHPEGVATGLTSAQAELEFLLKLSPTAARNMVGRTRQLAQLPTTLAALQAGAITQAGANIVADETTLLTPEHKAAVEADLFAAAGTHASTHTEPRLKREVRDAIARVDPELVKARHEGEKKRRDVTFSAAPFGMARITAYLTASEAQAVAGIVKAQAKTSKGDGRYWGQRKADAFCEFFLGPKNRPKPRVSTQVRVVVPAGSLLGLGDEPGYLAGYGAIPADLARDLAADATWRRLLTDPATGEVLDYGTTRYRPTGALIERVRARDGECDAPTCQMAAHDSDLDHEIPFRPDGTGGATSETNLRARCQHHHDVKGLPGWKVRTNRDGTTTWTTPDGRTYLSHPPRFTPQRR